MIKLICFLLAGMAGTMLMIHYDKEMGILRIPLVIVIGLSYFGFFKLLVENWRGAGVSVREQKAIRLLGYIVISSGLLAILVNLALTFYNVR